MGIDLNSSEGNSAIGDFTGDGMLDFILMQQRDNNDGSRSSRVYRYEVPPNIVSAHNPKAVQSPTFVMAQSYPNPFNPKTTISYSLAKVSHVKLEIFNLVGQVLDIPVDEIQPAGNYKLTFDASRYPSGVYFYRIRAGAFRIRLRSSANFYTPPQRPFPERMPISLIYCQ